MFHIVVDISDLEDLKSLNGKTSPILKKAAQDLAGMAYTKSVELANDKLKSRRRAFIEGLSVSQDGDVSIVTLDAKVRWIDDGKDPYDMLDTLLASPKAKRAKDGSKYLVVPFSHGPGGGNNVSPQSDLVSTLKSELKKRNIPWGKIEKSPDGQALQGRLHSFNIKGPNKTKSGPGQGHGRIGDPKQGNTGIPFLHGVSIYQHTDKNTSKTKRSIMTFRVASSKHKGQKWMHPGLEPVNIIDETYDWLVDTWENNIAPKVASEVLSLVKSG